MARHGFGVPVNAGQWFVNSSDATGERPRAAIAWMMGDQYVHAVALRLGSGWSTTDRTIGRGARLIRTCW